MSDRIYKIELIHTIIYQLDVMAPNAKAAKAIAKGEPGDVLILEKSQAVRKLQVNVVGTEEE